MLYLLSVYFSSVTVNRRDIVINVAAEDIHMTIFVHEKDGNKFLWPVLTQRTSASNTEGILGGCVCVYIATLLESC